MIQVRVIERRLCWGWETLLVVNGAIARAEDLVCLEDLEKPQQPYLMSRTDLLDLESWGIFPSVRGRATAAIAPIARSANFAER